MTGLVANLLLNIVIVALLVVTISYCWVLNRRIKVLQDSKSELAQLLKHFDESTQRASESIIALQSASKKIGENIQSRIDKANFLLDDLAFMIEKGNKITTQIEAGVAVNRAQSRVNAEQQSHAVRPVPVMERPEPAAQPKTAASKAKAVASLEAVLERVVNRGKPVPVLEDDEAAAGREMPRARSKTEQELLAMIRAGIKG